LKPLKAHKKAQRVKKSVSRQVKNVKKASMDRDRVQASKAAWKAQIPRLKTRHNFAKTAGINYH
jgi:hypothetical protein